MKKIIFLLLFSISTIAQNIDPYVSFSGGIDTRNATIGSTPTKDKPELDFLIGFQMVSFSRIEVGIFYENFKRIEFSRYGVSAGYQFTICDKLSLTPALQFSMINRGPVEQEYSGHGSFLSYGGILNVKYHIGGNFYLGAKGELILRTDKNYLIGGNNWTGSLYAELTYVIPLTK